MKKPRGKSTRRQLMRIYELMREAFGHRKWWPGDTAFEIMIGAILTQNASWANVEKALHNLKTEDMLSPEGIRDADLERLAELVKPSRYYNQKAIKLKDFVEWFLAPPYKGSAPRLKRRPAGELRDELLSIRGIGPETADDILCYALDKPVFVVDAYTRRAFHRLGFLREDASYDETRRLFMENLPEDLELFNDYHAQIVHLGQMHCRPKPICEGCPLKPLKKCKPPKPPAKKTGSKKSGAGKTGPEKREG